MDEREVVPNDVFNTALQTAENEKKYWTVGLEHPGTYVLERIDSPVENLVGEYAFHSKVENLDVICLPRPDPLDLKGQIFIVQCATTDVEPKYYGPFAWRAVRVDN